MFQCSPDNPIARDKQSLGTLEMRILSMRLSCLSLTDGSDREEAKILRRGQMGGVKVAPCWAARRERYSPISSLLKGTAQVMAALGLNKQAAL